MVAEEVGGGLGERRRGHGWLRWWGESEFGGGGNPARELDREVDCILFRVNKKYKNKTPDTIVYEALDAF